MAAQGWKDLQPCVSPILNITLKTVALSVAGLCQRDENLVRAAGWITARQQLGPVGD